MADFPSTSTRRVAQRPSVPSAEVDCYAHFAICRFEDGRPDLLGRGGMGATYRAFDLQLQRPVALKTINPQHVDDPEARSRFLREARAAARIQHPHVAGVLYQGEENNTCFYVMELVTGESLSEYVVRVGTLEPAAALVLAHQVALALDAAHREQVLHRDLKPGNIMLTRYHDQRQLHVKVIDFGLAKLLLEGQASFVTMPGFLGTPGFASPEQCQELPMDGRADLYSLGATLWFMLSGGPPFMGSALSVIKAHVEIEPDFGALAGCPAPVVALLRRLLAKNPDDRPSSALEAVDEIGRALVEIGGAGSTNLPPVRETGEIQVKVEASPAPVRGRGWTGWAALLAAVLMVLGAGFWWGVRERESAPRVPVTFLPSDSTVSSNKSLPTPSPVRPAPEFVEPLSAPLARENKEFINGLGMKFRPLGVFPGLLSFWEVRVQDYRTYAKQSGISVDSGTVAWDRPGFEQGPYHPVVWVSMMDAKKFCQWLTAHDRNVGTITATQYYRLPTRLEMDAAQGRIPPDVRAKIEAQSGARPLARPLEGPYPWGLVWPPPKGAGNFADQSALSDGAVAKAIPGYEDGYSHTAPVGSFPGQDYADLVGNVWEMVISHPGDPEGGRQGAGWTSLEEDDFRHHRLVSMPADYRAADLGFRCILVDENDPKPPVPERGNRSGPSP